MDLVLSVILDSGQRVVNLALFTLIPIMTVMMAFMRVLEDRGVIRWIAGALSAPMLLFGLPGIGVFAMLQLTFVSYAAPLATLKIIEGDTAISRRQLAATLAMIIAMSQSNALFPLSAVGLNLGVTLITSLLAGLAAASICYYGIGRKLPSQHASVEHLEEELPNPERRSLLALLSSGGEEGIQMVFKAFPLLLISLIFVNALSRAGAIDGLTVLLNPVFSRIGIPAVAVLPIFTKFVAGGTAMMGITIELIQDGLMSAADLNRIAGFIVNPYDIIGIAFYMTAGEGTRSVAKPAVLSAGIAIVLRGISHLIIFPPA